MTKAFTALSILKLRDEGKLALDAPVETYVPELRGWKYPTDDSPKIRVRELLTHTAGFVTDDPWGDRQTPLPEEDFTRLLRDGVPFTRPPAMAMEYSNLGYALLGRIVANVSGQPYKDFVQRTAVHAARHDLHRLRRRCRAAGASRPWLPLGRRRLEARADDGARRVRRDGRHPDQRRPTTRSGSRICSRRGRRATAPTPDRCGVRACASWRKARTSPRSGCGRDRADADACREASTYGMGFYAATDCELGLTLSHGGGYPGYGSHVLLLPDYGVGIFALANRTYAGPRPPVWDAAVTLLAGRTLEAAIVDAVSRAHQLPTPRP